VGTHYDDGVATYLTGADMSLTSTSVNYWWSRLNHNGRISMRAHYRALRNIGLDRHVARMVVSDALWGLGMARYWVA
jgi:hypothetical protein